MIKCKQARTGEGKEAEEQQEQRIPDQEAPPRNKEDEGRIGNKKSSRLKL